MTKADEEANEELLEHLKIIDAGIHVEPRPTLGTRLAHAWKPLKVKAALAHIGLMISLAVYCVVGGIVCITSIYSNFILSPLSSTRLTPCYLFFSFILLVYGCSVSPSSKDDFASFQQRKMLATKDEKNFFHSTECRRQSVCVPAKHEGMN